MSNELLLYEQNTAFYHSLWDRYEWLSLLEFSNRLSDLHAYHNKTYQYSAAQDAFYALADVDPNTSKAGQAWMRVMTLPEFPRLQEMARTTRNAKANVVHWLANKFIEFFYEEPPEPEEEEYGLGGEEEQTNPQPTQDQDQQPSNDQALQDAKALVMEEGDQGGGDMDSDPQAGPQTGAQIELPAKIQITSEEIDKLGEENLVYDMMAGLFPGGKETPIQVRDFIEEIFDYNALRRAAKIFGWGQKVMGAAKRENRGAIGEMVGFRQNGWSDNTDPIEMAEIADGDLMALARLADNNLRTRTYGENIPLGKGPVLFLHDESSSMQDGTSGQIRRQATRRSIPLTTEDKAEMAAEPSKDMQAINLQVALAALVRGEGRRFTAIAWNDDTTRTYEYGQPGLKDHLTQFLSGNTEINHVLEKAFEVARQDPDYRKGGDIVVVTDGMISDAPQEDDVLWKQLLDFKANGGRIWCIYVGQLEKNNHYWDQLNHWVDFAVSVDNLYNDTNLAEIFKGVAKSTKKHKRTSV